MSKINFNIGKGGGEKKPNLNVFFRNSGGSEQGQTVTVNRSGDENNTTGEVTLRGKTQNEETQKKNVQQQNVLTWLKEDENKDLWYCIRAVYLSLSKNGFYEKEQELLNSNAPPLVPAGFAVALGGLAFFGAEQTTTYHNVLFWLEQQIRQFQVAAGQRVVAARVKSKRGTIKDTVLNRLHKHGTCFGILEPNTALFLAETEIANANVEKALSLMLPNLRKISQCKIKLPDASYLRSFFLSHSNPAAENTTAENTTAEEKSNDEDSIFFIPKADSKKADDAITRTADGRVAAPVIYEPEIYLVPEIYLLPAVRTRPVNYTLSEQPSREQFENVLKIIFKGLVPMSQGLVPMSQVL